MIEATARAAAYVAGRLVTAQHAGAMVDRVSGVRWRFAGDVQADRVALTDLETSCLITGRAVAHGPLWLFHQDTMRHLTLTTQPGGTFTGLDYSTGHTFDVLAGGDGIVELLDHDTGRRRRYQLQLAPALASSSTSP
ncbi:hypothetical protein [Modestobacter altitudinis]|uniref:hypothetical protein n=1 Tax=Modestobacter altitudinis TaxID=2213158 RepID=UPI00110CAD26|nr:hypothetical protein [Modestobacter altitudinis]